MSVFRALLSRCMVLEYIPTLPTIPSITSHNLLYSHRFSLQTLSALELRYPGCARTLLPCQSTQFGPQPHRCTENMEHTPFAPELYHKEPHNDMCPVSEPISLHRDRMLGTYTPSSDARCSLPEMQKPR